MHRQNWACVLTPMAEVPWGLGERRQRKVHVEHRQRVEGERVGDKTGEARHRLQWKLIISFECIPN